MDRKELEQLKEDISKVISSDEHDTLLKKSQELDELLLENMKNNTSDI